MLRMTTILVLLVSMAVIARAEIVTKTIEYKHGDVTLKGYLAYDDKVETPRPGVIVVHEWWGLTEHMKKMTRDVAALGYVAFAVDMYGEGVTTDQTEKAAELAGGIRKDLQTYRDRAKAGYETLAKMDIVNRSHIAAIGFCFGGTTVLNMAYSGLPLAGVVSFHGSLVAPEGEDLTRIKARILVLHGADDPLVSPESIKAFHEGMRKAKADWQMMYYGGAVHSFTNPTADKTGIPGVKYDAKTDKRARQAMKDFFDEIFAD
ncbi:MAG: dienelactone hydrolase [Planctomycetota bacterium]